jgi:hypothetical protein
MNVRNWANSDKERLEVVLRCPKELCKVHVVHETLGIHVTYTK